MAYRTTRSGTLMLFVFFAQDERSLASNTADAFGLRKSEFRIVCTRGRAAFFLRQTFATFLRVGRGTPRTVLRVALAFLSSRLAVRNQRIERGVAVSSCSVLFPG